MDIWAITPSRPRRGAVVDLVAAARRGLEQVEASLERRVEGEGDSLIAIVVLARAADEATFALLDAHARERRLAAGEGRSL